MSEAQSQALSPNVYYQEIKTSRLSHFEINVHHTIVLLKYRFILWGRSVLQNNRQFNPAHRDELHVSSSLMKPSNQKTSCYKLKNILNSIKLNSPFQFLIKFACQHNSLLFNALIWYNNVVLSSLFIFCISNILCHMTEIVRYCLNSFFPLSFAGEHFK